MSGESRFHYLNDFIEGEGQLRIQERDEKVERG